MIQAEEIKKEGRKRRRVNDEYNEMRLSAKYFAGYEKAKPSFGEMHEANQQLAPLPPVGSRIQLTETVWKDRNLLIDGKKVRSFDVPYANCIAEGGEIKEFVVESYTRGIDRPFLSNNLMILKCVYPESSRKTGIYTVQARCIAVGNIHVVYMDEEG